jgi:hypothetical protein
MCPIRRSNDEVAQRMNEFQGNVVVLPTRDRAPGTRRSTDPQVLRAASGYLDELRSCLERLSPDQTWSARQWMIASTPFRMRLASVRTRLDELADLRELSGADDACWLFELKDALARVRRRLHDLDAGLRTLQHEATPRSARPRETRVFISHQADLMDAAIKVRALLSERLTAQAGRR